MTETATTATARLGDLAADAWFTLNGPYDMWRVCNHWSTGVEIASASSTPQRRVISPDTRVTRA